jgi:hypothetical protein
LSGQQAADQTVPAASDKTDVGAAARKRPKRPHDRATEAGGGAGDDDDFRPGGRATRRCDECADQEVATPRTRNSSAMSVTSRTIDSWCARPPAPAIV